MKLNKKLITELRNGKIAVENNGTLEQLREVLKEAFHKDKLPPGGTMKYYKMDRDFIDRWNATDSTTLPTISVADFYQPEQFTGWAKDDRIPDWMIYFREDVGQFGFNAHGNWRDNYYGLGNFSDINSNRPATHEEIEQGLAEEAKRRGYKGGNTIKGIHMTSHSPGGISFYYEVENNRLVTHVGCVVFENGQWAEIVEQPQPKKPTTINYLVDDMKYSFNYQELKAKYLEVVNYSDEQFMDNLPQIAHFACIVSYFKGLGAQATISDKGIIHELIHLMTDPDEPTNDLAEIRQKFNKLIQLV